MRTRNWIDFDDLVGLALRVLTEQPEIAAQYREQFRFISVDEFQDIDEPQYRLIAQLAPPRREPVRDRRSRSGDLRFPRRRRLLLRAAARATIAPAEVRLTRNYRSSGTIVAASAQMLGPRERGAESIVRADARAHHDPRGADRARRGRVRGADDRGADRRPQFLLDRLRARRQWRCRPVVFATSPCCIAPMRSRPRSSRRWRAPAFLS